MTEELGGATRCPRCASTAPHLHPAVQSEGEVQICTDPFHSRVTSQNTPDRIAYVAALPAVSHEPGEQK